MNNLMETLKQRTALIQRAIKLAEKEKETFGEGRLRISKTKHQTRYFKVVDKGDSTGEYLSKDKMSIIQKLAQKDYNKQFLRVAKVEQDMLEKLIEKCDQKQAEDVYNALSSERKTLVTPYILPDDLIAQEWQSKKFKPNPYKPEKKIFDTRRGEKVRSKSEAIIADMLYEMGIVNGK